MEDSKKKQDSFTIAFDNFSKNSTKVSAFEIDSSRNRSLKTSKFEKEIVFESKNF